MLTTQDLEKMGIDELNKELLKASREHFKVKLDVTSGQEKQNHLVSANKRYIARIKTFITKKSV